MVNERWHKAVLIIIHLHAESRQSIHGGHTKINICVCDQSKKNEDEIRLFSVYEGNNAKKQQYEPQQKRLLFIKHNILVWSGLCWTIKYLFSTLVRPERMHDLFGFILTISRVYKINRYNPICAIKTEFQLTQFIFAFKTLTIFV